MAGFITAINQKLGAVSGFDFLGLGLQPFYLACIYLAVVLLIIAAIVIICVKAGNGGKYKSRLIKKWSVAMPTAEVLLDFWPQMPEEDHAKTVELAKTNQWLAAYLADCGKNEKAYDLFLALWPLLGEAQGDLLKAMVEELASIHPDQSLAVCGLLKELKDDRSVPLLLVALLQNDKFLPARVCDALSVFGHVSGKSLAALYSNAPEDKKTLVLDALGLLKEFCPIDVLGKAMADANLEVRQKTAEVIGIVRPANVISFIDPLLKDSEGKVRAAAAKALSDIGGEEMLMPLTTLAEQDSDWQVKTTCQAFLTRWHEVIRANVEIDEAELWLKDRDKNVRAN